MVRAVGRLTNAGIATALGKPIGVRGRFSTGISATGLMSISVRGITIGRHALSNHIRIITKAAISGTFLGRATRIAPRFMPPVKQPLAG